MSQMPYTPVTSPTATNDQCGDSGSTVVSADNWYTSALQTTQHYLIEQYGEWLQFACSSPERKIIAIATLAVAGLFMIMLIKRIHAV